MPVPAQATLFNESDANGVTTSFPYQFMIASADDLAVELDGVATTTGFTVTGVGDANGGDIVFSVPPANGVKVLRYLNSKLNRTEDYQQFGDFNAETVDREFDRLWLAMQSLALKLGLCVRAPISSASGVLPAPAANNVIGWNEDGTGFKNFPPVDNELLSVALASEDGASFIGISAPDGSQKLVSDIAVNNDAGKGAALVGFYDSIAPAYLKTISDIANGLPVSFFRFIPKSKISGIRARTNSDDLSANFADALASGCAEINFEPGLYNVSSAIAMSVANQRMKGAGWNRCEIRIVSTTASAITLASGVGGYGLSGFKISRTGTPGANALGVEFLGTTDDSLLEDLWIEGHYTNLKIGTCDTGKIRHLRLNKALAYGVYQTNSASYGPSQWDVDDVLMDRNTVDGWRVQSTDGPAGLILGPMRNVKSFANGGRGIHLIGSSTTPIYDVRINDAFLGSDGLGSIRLDTYGGKHRISGFFERNGRDATGPTLATAATNTAPGIEMSANNVDLVVYGSTIDDNAYDGIQHDGGILTVVASHIYNNGAASTAGRRNGILSNGGRLVVGSDVICNAASVSGGGVGSSQLYGVATAHDNVTIAGNDISSNATGPVTLGATTNASVVGNTPSTLVSRTPSTIDVVKFNSAYTPTATGGDKGAGTVNVAAGLFKNNTAYTNP